MSLDFDEYWYLGVSKVSDYESSFEIFELKMAEQSFKISLIRIKIVLWRFYEYSVIKDA